MKPKLIIQNIEMKQLSVLKLKDLYNYLQTLRKKRLVKSNMTIGDLATFCLAHSELPAENLPNQPFVLDYVIFDQSDPDRLIDYEDEDQFRLVISTRNLLKFSLHFKLVLQTDGTYKLIKLLLFIKYFKDEWIDNNSNWFESYNHPNDAGSTSNNNGNESINGIIKTEGTLRNLLSLNAFMSVAFNIIQKWSWAQDETNVNCIKWASLPSISLKQWTDTYKWKKNVKRTLLHKRSLSN